MAVKNSDILKEIEAGDYKSEKINKPPVQKQGASAVSGDFSDIADEISQGEYVSENPVAAQEKPEPRTRTMQTAAYNTPNDENAKGLLFGTEFINKALGKDFLTGHSEEVVVEGKTAKGTSVRRVFSSKGTINEVRSGMPTKDGMVEVDTGPMTERVESQPQQKAPELDLDPLNLQQAKKDINIEVQAAGNYLQQDAKEALGVYNLLPEAFKDFAKKLGVSPETVVENALDPNGHKESLGKYMDMRMGQLHTQKDLELKNLQSDMRQSILDDKYDEKAYHAQLAELDERYKEKMGDLTNAAFGMAAQKAVYGAVNEGKVVTLPHGTVNSKISPYDIGAEIDKMLGDKHGVEKAERLRKNYGIVDPNEKVARELTGYRALEYMKYVAAANDNFPLAKALDEEIHNYPRKILDNNPEFKRQQILTALSDHIFKDANPIFTTLTGYKVGNEDMKKAQQELGISDTDMAGIKPEDVPRMSNILNRFAGSVVGHTSAPLAEAFDRHIVNKLKKNPTDPDLMDYLWSDDWYDNSDLGKFLKGDKITAAQLFQPAIKVDTDPNSQSHLLNVQNPEAGDFNMSAGAISSVMADGAGQIFSIAYGGGGIGSGLRAARLVKSANAANRVGMGMWLYATGYDRNYKTAKENIGEDPADENKRVLLANLYTGVEIFSEQILPDKQIMDKIFASASGRELVNRITTNGFKDVSKEMFSNYLVKGFKEGVKDWGKEVSEDVINVWGNAVADMFLAPQHFESNDYLEETKQAAVTSAFASMLPTVGGGLKRARSKGPMYKLAMYQVGSKPQLYIDAINKDVSEGKLLQEDANAKIQTVNLLSDIVNTSIPSESIINGKRLTLQQRIDYAANLLQEGIVSGDAQGIKDEVQAEHLKKYVADLKKEREQILANAGKAQTETPANDMVDLTAEEAREEAAEAGSLFDDPEWAAERDRIEAAEAETNDEVLSIEDIEEEPDVIDNFDGDGQQLSNNTGNIEIGDAGFDIQTSELSQDGVEAGSGGVLGNNTVSDAAIDATVSGLSEEVSEIGQQEAGGTIVEDVQGDGQSAAETIIPGADAANSINTTSATEAPIITPEVSAAGEVDQLGTAAQSELAVGGPNITGPVADGDGIVPGTQAEPGTNATAATAETNIPAPAAGTSTPLDNFLNAPRSEAEEAETAKVGSNIREKFQSAAKRLGFPASRTLRNKKKLKGRFMLVPANSITPSNNPKTWGTSEGLPVLDDGSNPNDRDYTSKVNQERVTKRAGEYNGEAVQNMPIVDKNGVVLSGNDRTMSGQLAAEQGTEKEYLDALKENAMQYGFNSDEVEEMIAAGEHPRVIFVPDEILPYETASYAMFNPKESKDTSALEDAMKFRRTLDPDVVERIGNILERHEDMNKFYEDTFDQRDVYSLLKRVGVISDEDGPTFFNEATNTFTDAGRALLDNILLSQILDNEALKLVQGVSDEYKGLRNKLIRAAKGILEVDRKADMGLAQTVSETVKLWKKVDEHLKKKMPKGANRMDAMEDYLRQYSLFGDTDETMSMVQIYQALLGSPKKFQIRVSEMAKRANPTTTLDMFGNAPSSKLQIILDARQAASQYQEVIDEENGNLNEPTINEDRPTEQSPAGDSEQRGLADVNGQLEGDGQTTEQVEETASQSDNSPQGPVSELDSLKARMEESVAEINRLNAMIPKAQAAMEEAEKKGRGDLMFKVKQAAWQQLNMKLKDEQREYKAMLRSYDAKTVSNKVRGWKKNIDQAFGDDFVSAVGLEGAILQAVKILGKPLVKAAIDVLANTIEAGATLRTAIDQAIEYIKDRYKGDTPFDEAGFRTGLGYDEVAADLPNTDLVAAAEMAKTYRLSAPGPVLISAKNQKIANRLVDQISRGEEDLESVKRKINEQSQLTDRTRNSMLKYIEYAVNGDPNKFAYDVNSQQAFIRQIHPMIAKGLNLGQIIAELEASPLMRGAKLTFAEKETIKMEMEKYAMANELLNEAYKVTGRENVRAFMRRISDTAFVSSDFQLAEYLTRLDGKYQIESHKELLEYVDDIIKEFGVAEAERMAMHGVLAPARRQVLLARIAQQYEAEGNDKALETMLNRIAFNATQYGQGVEATKIVYELLGMVGAKGVNPFIMGLVDALQSTYLAAHQKEVDELKQRIEDMKKKVANRMKSDRKLLDKMQNVLEGRQARNKVEKVTRASDMVKVRDAVSNVLSGKTGQISTPQQVNEVRAELAEAVRRAYPLMPAEELDEIVEDIGDKYNQEVKNINEGKLYDFYVKVMFRNNNTIDLRDTRIAEKLMNVVNAGINANNGIDVLTLDAIRQEFGIDLNTPGFAQSLIDLVQRANSDPASLEKGNPSRLKDDIAKLVNLYTVQDTVDLASAALDQDAKDMAIELGSTQDGSIDRLVKFVQQRYDSLNLSQDEAVKIAEAVSERWKEMMVEESDKYLSKHLGKKDRKAEANQGKFYNKVLAEINALRLGDSAFQQAFAEKYGLLPFSEADFQKMRDIAEKIKEAKVGTGEYAKLEEQFYLVIALKDPKYLTNLYNGLRATKVLSSILFTVKTLVSNIHKVWWRGVNEFLWSVKQGNPDYHILRMTFNSLQRLFTGEKMDNYALDVAKHVVQGGPPVSNIYDQEFAKKSNNINIRLEEFARPGENVINKAARAVTRMGARVQNTVDSWGQIHNQELVQRTALRQLVTQELRSEKPETTNDEILAETDKRWALVEESVAADKAREEFTRLGEVVPEDSSRFRNRVNEIRRENRPQETLDYAREIARYDFWKATDRRAGRASAGLGGIMEEFLSMARDAPRKLFPTAGSLALYDAGAFQIYGFIGGTTRFFEDGFEAFLPYGLVKAGILQKAKGQMTDEAMQKEISKKQFEIMTKNLYSVLFSAAVLGTYNLMKALAGAPPPEDDDKKEWGVFGDGGIYSLSNVQTYRGIAKNGFMVKGHKIPFESFVPEQMGSWIKLYANVEDYARSDQEKLSLQQFLLTGWETTAKSPLGTGTFDALFKIAASGKNSPKAEKLEEFLYNKIGNFTAGFIPVPQRLIGETWQLFDQRQMAKIEPTIPIDDNTPNEFYHKSILNAAGRAVFSTTQVLGINNILGSAGVLNRPAVDYRGREVNAAMQYTSFGAFPNMLNGDALKYDEMDNLLATSHAKVAYIPRYSQAQKMFVNKDDPRYNTYDPNTGKKVDLYQGMQRDMTDAEYHDFQYSMGKIVNNMLTARRDEMFGLKPEEVPIYWNAIQSAAQKYAKMGVERGLSPDEIISGFEQGKDLAPPEPKINIDLQ